MKYKAAARAYTNVDPKEYNIPPTVGPIITANSETDDIKADAFGKTSFYSEPFFKKNNLETRKIHVSNSIINSIYPSIIQWQVRNWQ